jgi:hypothetical protein
MMDAWAEYIGSGTQQRQVKAVSGRTSNQPSKRKRVRNKLGEQL